MCGRKGENRKDYVFQSHRKFYIFENNIKLSQMLVVIRLCEASHVVRFGFNPESIHWNVFFFLIDFSGEINIRLFQFVQFFLRNVDRLYSVNRILKQIQFRFLCGS